MPLRVDLCVLLCKHPKGPAKTRVCVAGRPGNCGGWQLLAIANLRVQEREKGSGGAAPRRVTRTRGLKVVPTETWDCHTNGWRGGFLNLVVGVRGKYA